ncbi:DUF1127 domain-containing protein [Belnapia sp. T6]|uniref:DUF1127 domain-containing protein n=1 Tax=Belnapia mucosa TaxID=2804532 RepID=A0ABS1V9C0_9PROT|nr:DUF1127 domain-containing protein [Belnapia mucosa]MBL6458232.1 DUF1127 domain-containing protein [Belnapia mucosa]
MHTIIASGRPLQFELWWSPLRAIHRWYREQRTAAILGRMDDRMLKDIGIDRSTIPYEARRHSIGPGGC